MKNILPKYNNKTDIKQYLSNLTKNELIVIARKHNKRVLKLNKEQLIEELLSIEPRTELIKILEITWWDKYNQHVYGIAGIIGTVLAIISAIPLFTNTFSAENVLDNVIIKASLMSEQDALKQVKDFSFLKDSYNTFRYRDTIINGLYTIKPCNDYLNKYYDEKKVIIQEFPWWEWIINPHNPFIDVKIVNNSNQTLFVDKIVAEVKESVLDERHLLLLHREEANTSSFLIINESWRDWKFFDFKFSFSKHDRFSGDYKYSKRVDYFDFRHFFDLKPYLENEGVNYARLQKIALREFGYIYEIDTVLDIKKSVYLIVTDSIIMNEINDCLPSIVNKADVNKGSYGGIPYVYLFGQLTFPDYGDTIKVEGMIPITYGDGGAMIVPVESFNMNLKSEGNNYNVEYPVSISIKPNEAERISIQLNAPKSSFHKLRFKLNNINGVDIYSNDLSLELFKQRSMTKKKNKIVEE